jgi:hypothetical protein
VIPAQIMLKFKAQKVEVPITIQIHILRCKKLFFTILFIQVHSEVQSRQVGLVMIRILIIAWEKMNLVMFQPLLFIQMTVVQFCQLEIVLFGTNKWTSINITKFIIYNSEPLLQMDNLSPLISRRFTFQTDLLINCVSTLTPLSN